MSSRYSFLANIRKESGYNNMKEVADRLCMSPGQLSHIENGLRSVSKDQAQQLADLYNKKVEEIFLPTRYAVRKVYE